MAAGLCLAGFGVGIWLLAHGTTQPRDGGEEVANGATDKPETPPNGAEEQKTNSQHGVKAQNAPQRNSEGDSHKQVAKNTSDKAKPTPIQPTDENTNNKENRKESEKVTSLERENQNLKERVRRLEASPPNEVGRLNVEVKTGEEELLLDGQFEFKQFVPGKETLRRTISADGKTINLARQDKTGIEYTATLIGGNKLKQIFNYEFDVRLDGAKLIITDGKHDVILILNVNKKDR